MSRRDIWIVFATDLTNTLRDRRTWLAMVVIPLLLIPVLLIAAPTAIEGERRRLAERPPVVAVAGAEHAPELISYLREGGFLLIGEVGDPAAALRTGDVAAVLRLEAGFQAAVERGETGGAVIEYDVTRTASEYARARLEQGVGAYAQGVVARRLSERGVDPALLSPVRVTAQNVASDDRVGASFHALIMPMILAVWSALGGMYAAIDGVAGEKERGTLEPLLATPPGRASLVAGKYLTVVLTSVVASAIAILGMYLAFLIKPEAVTGRAGAGLSITPANALVALATAVLLSAFFSAVQLALSAFARSFREAQSYLSPISVAVVLPGVMTQFADPAAVGKWMYYVPIVNAILLFKQVLTDAVDYGDFLTMCLASLVLIVLALRFTVWIFHKESVLFRT